MHKEERPYITSCSFCGDGLARFSRCSNCDEIVAVCDECELMWENIEQLSHDPNCASDSNYPQCPSCGERQARWTTPSMEEIEENGLAEYFEGESV